MCRCDDPTARHRLYRALCRLFKPLTEETRQRALCDLRVWASLSDRGPSPRMLTREDVRRSAEAPGRGRRSHGVAPGLGEPSAHHSAQGNRLQQGMPRSDHGSAGQNVCHPYGTRADYTKDTAVLVNEEGFALACSNYPETVTGTSDVHQLPRFVVRDWTEARFASMLAAWWDGREGDEPCDQ